MRKLLLLSLFLVSCKKDMLEPQVQPVVVKDFFSVPMNTVSNGDSIVFSLQSAGTYTLTMVDTAQNQVITREKFVGKAGSNTLNIYTKTISQTYLSVVLMDQNNNQINKTKITIK